MRLGWPITYLNGVLSLTGGKFSIMYQILQSLDLPSGLYFRWRRIGNFGLFKDTLTRTTGGKINFFLKYFKIPTRNSNLSSVHQMLWLLDVSLLVTQTRENTYSLRTIYHDNWMLHWIYISGDTEYVFLDHFLILLRP